jgi:hypothetical protein
LQVARRCGWGQGHPIHSCVARPSAGLQTLLLRELLLLVVLQVLLLLPLAVLVAAAALARLTAAFAQQLGQEEHCCPAPQQGA